MIDRRQLLIGLLLFPRLAMSRQSSGSTRLNERLSLMTGVGTNVLALTTGDGLVLVDSGAPEFSASLMKQVAGLAGSKRVQTVFNTHYHLENTGSNEALAQAGAKIIAHESTREWMATPYWVPSKDRYEKPR